MAGVAVVSSQKYVHVQIQLWQTRRLIVESWAANLFRAGYEALGTLRTSFLGGLGRAYWQWARAGASDIVEPR